MDIFLDPKTVIFSLYPEEIYFETRTRSEIVLPQLIAIQKAHDKSTFLTNQVHEHSLSLMV